MPMGVAAEMALDEKHAREDAIIEASSMLVDCERLHARIAPDACMRYRNSFVHGGENMICKQCPQAKDMDRLAADRPGVKRLVVAVPIGSEMKEENSENEPVVEEVGVAKKVCLDCQNVRSIVGRGLCSSCYSKNKKAGTLDERFPKLGRGVAEANERQFEDFEVAETVSAVAQASENNMGGNGPAVQDIPSAIEKIELHITERDKGLITFLQAWADDERRSIGDQVLFVLDNVVADKRLENDFNLPRECSDGPGPV